ncbi:hypothetical protein PIB30_116432, partial [Stylosanthes scabra]|nr:hypothetical protein [Stylosanthes scabra]
MTLCAETGHSLGRAFARRWSSLLVLENLPRGDDTAPTDASACSHPPWRAGRGSSGVAVFADR